MNRQGPSWRQAKTPIKRPKLNDTAYQSNPDFCNENLPIHSRRIDIMSTLASTQVLIVQGDTGCGKTTQIPQFILKDYPDARIIVTQPRRIAAVGVARRVAQETNTSLGKLIGYHIRGEKNYSPESKIVFMTTGMFIQELVGEKKLIWSHIILDEVHERALETEFLLVVLKHMLYKSNTKIVLMSATIDAKLFANYFADSEIKKIGMETLENNKAPIYANLDILISNPFDIDREDAAPIRLAGPRNFKVHEVYLDEVFSTFASEIFFSSSEREEIDSYYRGELISIDSHFYTIASHIIRMQHMHRIYDEPKPQTFLIFLPGLHEIMKMAKAIEDLMKDHIEELEICLLHSSIPEESHSNIFSDPHGKRRIIISTNIAESSITLPDVRYIIDFGLTKELVFNSTTKCERLQMMWACKAVMQQRSGRAGRVAEGVVFRLMFEDFYNTLKPHSTPEIQRCPLDKLVLKVKQLNLGSPQKILIRAIQPPDLLEIISTENYLREMGALNEDELTWLGKVYADMPCDVKVSRLCLFGYVFGCLHEAMVMGAVISQEKSIFVTCAQLEFRHSQYEAQRYGKKLEWDGLNHSDPIAALSAYKAWYFAHGKKYSKALKQRSFSRTSRQPVGIPEKNWCKYNALDYNVLREVSVTYQELKRRLQYMGIAKQHLANRIKKASDDIFILKLCIAAAYNERYLTSFYASEDEVQRRKKEQLLKDHQTSKVLIPGINPNISTEDILKVLETTRATSINVEINRDTAIVTFDPNESIRPLQMCLWLGTFPQRYRCGNFVVAKKFLQDRQKNNIELLNIENLPCVLQKVAYSQPREGMKIEIEHSKIGDKFVHIEAYCMGRPEYLYKLTFQDFVTGSIISMDDFSVCKVAIEENPACERWHMAVCGELIEKRNRTIATNVTLMPGLPLLPHLLSLCFTRNISLYEHGKRYGGVSISGSQIRFGHTFTGKDIEEINEIRKEISVALFDEKGILNPTKLTIREKVVKLVRKKRLPYVDDRWRDLISHAEQQEFVVEDLLENTSASDYLKPIQKLHNVKDDIRNWTEEGQRQIELEMMQIKASKEKLVIDIKRRARIAKLVRPEIVCKTCESAVCAYFNATPLEIDPISGIFKLTSIFGGVRFTQDLPEEKIEESFMESLQEQIVNVVEWALCLEGHLIGWKTSENCCINHLSPLNLLLPTGEIISWSSHLWRNGHNSFLDYCKKCEISAKTKNIDMTCQICRLTFKTPQEFFTHVVINNEHTENVTKFLREGY